MDKKEKAEFAKVFYSRQTLIRELGEAGEEKLANARVAVVGVGGLGSVSSLYLTLAGVGYIRVIDQDTLEPHNLHRQILYTQKDLNYPKAEVATKRLAKHNPLVHLEAASENLNTDNVETLLKGVDVVVDGLDNMPTRHIVNNTCVKSKIPYVFGAATGLEGNLSVFYPPKTGCLECLMPSNASGWETDACNKRGIIGASAGIIGTLQAMETIKLITGIGKPLLSKLMVCDFTDMDFTVLPISENPKCSVCHGQSKVSTRGERLVWLCDKDTANINPPVPLNLNLEQVYPIVKRCFEVRLKSQLAIMFTVHGLNVSLFAGGRMLLKGVKNERTALGVYREIMAKINPS
jgi:molybdopterin/thiamine biosynthesis adenylyltransferase